MSGKSHDVIYYLNLDTFYFILFYNQTLHLRRHGIDFINTNR